MAKKQNEATPNVNATANRDIVQRLNFLYQASVYLQSIAPALPTETIARKGKAKETRDEDAGGSMGLDADKALPSSPSVVAKGTGKKNKHRVGRKKTTGDLARSYVQCMRVVGQKTTVKIDPSLKRSLCANCSTTLVPGSSATVRVKKSPCHGHIMIYTCMHCKATKRIPAPPNSTASALLPTTSTAQLTTESTDASIGAQPSSEILDIPQSRRRKGDHPIHPLPLFARRDAGHVIFRGNERMLQDDDAGLGICFA